MWGAIKRGYGAIDKYATAGLLPGGPSPFGAGTLAGDAASSVLGVVRDPMGRGHSSSEAATARDHATGLQESAHNFSSAEAGAARAFASNEAEVARQFSSAEAVAARDHQEYMARNEHGMRMQSMRSAGLNPALAASLGGGTPPAGPAATAHAPSVPQAHGVGGSSPSASSPVSAVREVLDTARLGAEVANIRSITRRNNADAARTEGTTPHEIESAKAGVDLIRSQVAQTNASEQQQKALTREVQSRIAKLEHEISSAKSQADIDRVVAAFETDTGGAIKRWSDAVGLKGRDITQMVSIIGAIAKFFKSGKNLGPYSPDPERPFGF